MTINASSVASLVIIVALVVGCSGTSADSPAPSGTPSPSPTSAASESASAQALSPMEAAAVEAYRAMWQDMAVAARTSDHTSPLLARHATGAALRQLVNSLYADQQQGVVSKGEPVLHPRLGESDLQASPMRVVVEDCADSRNWLRYRSSDGKLADDTPGGNRQISADVRGTAGQWKVVDFRVRGVGSC